MNELIQIYKERKQMYLKLFAEGKSWEEARQIVDKQNFDERIDKIVKPVKKKVLILTKKYYEHPENYPKYDNYDAINVDRLEDIPYDYEGVIGVPITYVYYHNKPIICQTKPISKKFSQIIQFEIIGLMSGGKDNSLINGNDGRAKFYLNNKGIYARILIKTLA